MNWRIRALKRALKEIPINYNIFFYSRKIQITFGEHDRTFFSNKNFRISVSKVKIHESYKPYPYFVNDIAIIELEREVNTTGIINIFV